MIAVEDELLEIIEKNLVIVDVMRGSSEWDIQLHDDKSRAARALVNEAMPDFERQWNEEFGSAPAIK